MMAWCTERNSYIRCVAYLTDDEWYYCICNQFGDPTTAVERGSKNFWSYDWKSI